MKTALKTLLITLILGLPFTGFAASEEYIQKIELKIKSNDFLNSIIYQNSTEFNRNNITKETNEAIADIIKDLILVRVKRGFTEEDVVEAVRIRNILHQVKFDSLTETQVAVAEWTTGQKIALGLGALVLTGMVVYVGYLYFIPAATTVIVNVPVIDPPYIEPPQGEFDPEPAFQWPASAFKRFIHKDEIFQTYEKVVTSFREFKTNGGLSGLEASRLFKGSNRGEIFSGVLEKLSEFGYDVSAAGEPSTDGYHWGDTSFIYNIENFHPTNKVL